MLMSGVGHVRVVELVERHPLCPTAVNSSNGIEIKPNEIVPLQIDLAIGVRRYRFAPCSQPNLSAALRLGGRASLRRTP